MIRIEHLLGEEAVILQDRDMRLLLLANAIGALGTALVSPILETLTGPLNVSAAEIGLLVTAVAAPSIVFIPIMGLLSDRLGRKPLLVAGLLLFGIGGVGIAFTTDFRVILGLRVLQGIGFSSVTPNIITCLGDIYDGNAEATAQGFRFGVSGVSQAVFPAIAGAIVVVSWRYPFLIYGLAFPVAAVVAAWLDEPTDGDDGPPESESRTTMEYVADLLGLVRRRRVAAYLFARATVVLPFVTFLTYNSLVVIRLQAGSAGQAGLVVALFSVMYAIVATQTGRVLSRFDSPTIPLLAANVFLGGGLAGFAASPSVILAVPAVLAVGIGVGLTFSMYRSIITGLAPQQLRGGLVSLAESGARIVVTATPVVVGISLVSAESVLPPEAALRWVIVATGLLSGVVGLVAVVVARTSAPVPQSPTA
ncbi:MFS transporter [Haloplanus pelagicus]|uniref:MFS transporter n=1 Tax=Haloplanus pelagicus TaxID=2949995 RepID=UPI0020426260|nr:MFS transporter [Haloplanus sp. HW8-1]